MRSYKPSLQILKSKTSLLLLAVVFIALCGARPFDRVNFSGTWKMNEQKSDLGQFGSRMATKKMKITQFADSLTMEVTANSQQGGEVTRTERLTFDGKENETVLSPAARKKATAKWSDDGQSLTINSVVAFDRNGETMEIKITETWTLTDGGKTLSLQSNSSSGFGENAMKLVYDKDK